MNNTLEVILLGIIEGITEFLPISSTGHLLIAQHWLGRRSDLFTVFIQLGAIVAVTLIYRDRVWALTRDFNAPDNRDYLLKLGTAFIITVIGGLSARQAGIELPETVMPIAFALIVGGLAIFAIEHRAAQWSPQTQVTWTVAVAVGLAQIVAAVFPGTSRSAATIFAAMLAGLTARPAAIEFAFLVGIPTMFAASGYELMRELSRADGPQEPWGDLLLGFIVSAIVGFVAVKWLLIYIQSHRFTVFGWYRIVFGAGLLLLL